MDEIKQKEFLEVLFKGIEGYIDIRTFKLGTTGKFEKVDYFFERIKDIDRLIKLLETKKFKDLNIHFGVAPRYRQSGTEKDVKILRCFWCDLDCKRKNKPDLPTKKEALKTIEKFKLAPSIIIDSGNGYHLYWLLSKLINIRNKSDVLKLRGVLAGLSQALGGDVAGKDLSRLLRLPDTLNFKPENPEGLPVKIIKFEPGIVYNIKEFEPFYIEQEDLPEIDVNIKDVPIPPRFEKLLKKNKKLQNTYLTRNRPDLIDTSGSGYDMALTSILIKNKFTDSEIAAIIRSSKTGTKKKITKGYLAITIKKARAFIKKKKQKEPILKTFPPGLINLVNNGGVKKYLFKNEAGNLVITETWTDGAGIVYKPRQDLPIGYASMEVIDIDKEISWTFLLRDIEKYIKGHLELSDEIYYLTFGLWIMHTYLMEKIDITPYLYFVGLKGTGKSRAGQIAQKLAYKCLLETMPTAPVLFRTSDYFENALVNDEARFWGSDMDKDVARIVMSKYKRGVSVLRINQDKEGEKQIEIHNVFSPFIICTESNIPAAIEDRCIKFRMKKNKNPSVTGDWDLTEEQRLINLLTLFRARYCNEKFLKHKNIAQWRLGEILSPLYKILLLVDKNRIEEFEGFIKEEETSRATDEATSDNATIISILIDFYNEGEDIVATQDIAKRYNQGIENLNFQISPRSMGWKIKPFNFKKKAIVKWGQNNKLGWIIDRETLIELAERFSIETEIIPIDKHLEKIEEKIQLSLPD